MPARIWLVHEIRCTSKFINSLNKCTKGTNMYIFFRQGSAYITATRCDMYTSFKLGTASNGQIQMWQYVKFIKTGFGWINQSGCASLWWHLTRQVLARGSSSTVQYKMMNKANKTWEQQFDHAWTLEDRNRPARQCLPQSIPVNKGHITYAG